MANALSTSDLQSLEPQDLIIYRPFMFHLYNIVVTFRSPSNCLGFHQADDEAEEPIVLRSVS